MGTVIMETHKNIFQKTYTLHVCIQLIETHHIWYAVVQNKFRQIYYFNKN
jgi:hypothetical protein